MLSGGDNFSLKFEVSSEAEKFFCEATNCRVAKMLLNQPASIVDPRIAEPRIHHIKKAIASGQCERYSYTYEDSHIWHFDVTVAPIYGTEEIITIVSDAASWQLGYWLNRVKVAE